MSKLVVPPVVKLSHNMSRICTLNCKFYRIAPLHVDGEERQRHQVLPEDRPRRLVVELEYDKKEIHCSSDTIIKLRKSKCHSYHSSNAVSF